MDERMEFVHLGRKKKRCVRLDFYKMIILRVETLHRYTVFLGGFKMGNFLTVLKGLKVQAIRTSTLGNLSVR